MMFESNKSVFYGKRGVWNEKNVNILLLIGKIAYIW